MDRNRNSVTNGVAMNIVAAGVLAVGAAVACAATAAAEPPPPAPADPGVALPPPDPDAPAPPNTNPIDNPLTAFAQFFLNSTGQDLMLSQSAVPALPGSAPFSPPTADILAGSQLLNPTNYRVPPPDQESPYALAPATPGPFARVDGLRGVHAMVHGALGRMPADQLSEPLPGTAPAPGITIPAGPEQNLPDPALMLPPAPPPAE